MGVCCMVVVDAGELGCGGCAPLVHRLCTTCCTPRPRRQKAIRQVRQEDLACHLIPHFATKCQGLPAMALKFTRLRLLLVAGALLASSSIAADSAGSNTTTTSTSTVSSTDLLGWFNCSAITFADQAGTASSFLENGGLDFNVSTDSLNSYARRAQCTQYQAPLCHSGVCEDTQGRTVDVFVKRVMARSNPETRPNVWFLQGGPGYASPTSTLPWI